MTEFPKMLYRPRDEPNSDLGGTKLDTLVVNSLSEQEVAVRQGWNVELGDAIARVQSAERRQERTQAVRRWYERWEWALKALAVLLALITGGIALFKALVN
jgi:hypothetical protein